LAWYGLIVYGGRIKNRKRIALFRYTQRTLLFIIDHKPIASEYEHHVQILPSETAMKDPAGFPKIVMLVWHAVHM
jgi:hypothetical protein